MFQRMFMMRIRGREKKCLMPNEHIFEYLTEIVRFLHKKTCTGQFSRTLIGHFRP